MSELYSSVIETQSDLLMAVLVTMPVAASELVVDLRAPRSTQTPEAYRGEAFQKL
jgi:hypothetical protein